MIKKLCLSMLLITCVTSVLGDEAPPLAKDPILEKRVKAISLELRCLVCQNQTIADSNAGLAVDLKNQVREMLQKGMGEDEIKDFMVERYGDFVLYNPPMKGTTMVLWIGPLIMLMIALAVAVRIVRRRSVDDEKKRSSADTDRARELLKD
jgi:cytochrome c-type biogenesis protein CcmH